jgi:hypothetical protein
MLRLAFGRSAAPILVALSIASVRVCVDNAGFGGVESLRNVDIANIKTIRYFDGVAATARWGIDHGGGVIPVMTHQ